MSWANPADGERPRALVTGAAGFIGSHLVDHLLGLGWRVRGLDNLSTGRPGNLRAAESSPDFDLVKGSVLDADLVARLAADSTRVFHLAGRVGPVQVENFPEETVLDTIRATQNVLAAVRGRGIPLFCASSSEIYGDTHDLPLREDADLRAAPPAHPRSSYALGRGVSELLVHNYCRQGGGPAVVGRLFNTIGPRQSPDYGYVVPRFLRWALANQPIVVHGDGEQTRCFTAVTDVVPALAELLDQPEAYSRTVNIGSRNEVTINDLARLVIDLTGSASPIRHVPYEHEHGAGARDIRRRLPDTSVLRGLIARELSTPLDAVIEAMLADIRQQPAPVARGLAPGRRPGAGRPRIAVLGQGTRGDLYPLLGIARTLAAREHHVDVLEYDEYRDDVTAAGLSFVRVGPGSQCADAFARAPAGPLTMRTEWVIDRLYFEASLGSAEAFAAAGRRMSPRPDALLAPGHHVGAALMSELLGIPLVSVFLGPNVLRLVSDRARAAVAPDSGREHRARAREQSLIDRFALPRVAGIRRSLSLAPLPADASFAREPDRGGLLLTPEVLLDEQEPVPAEFDVAGYPDYFGVDTPLGPAEVEDFVAPGGPPVVVCSLGDGWARPLPEPLRELPAEAARGRYRLLIVSGRMPARAHGRGTLVTPTANLRLLLRRADVCVHHGGMGTVIAALRGAVPSVTVPQWPDGRRNAIALARRGLGSDLGSDCRPEDVALAVDDALADEARSDRLRRARDAMRNEPDPASAFLARLAREGVS